MNALERRTPAGQSSTSVPSMTQFLSPQSLTAESSINMSGRICKEPGCDRPIFQTTYNIELCHFHKIQQQHKNATGMKLAVAFKTASVPKPIKKKKLYNFKLDDELKQLKRKRSSVEDSSTRIHPQNLQQQGSGSSSVSDANWAKSTPQPTPQQRTQEFNLVGGMGSGQSKIGDYLTSSLRSGRMVESAIDVLDANWEGNHLM
jgi:hypothetical protein